MTATEGPGLTNLATGIAAAYKGNVPVISICGIQESLMQERDATQDIDQTTFMRPITKWAHTIPAPDKVQEFVRKAFRVALTEPQGPTHIDASSEILLQPVKPEPIEPARYRNVRLPACDPAQLDEVAELIARAQRPVFVVGRGVISEGATQAMAELADRTGIPVAALQYSPDAFPTTHALALGPLGRNGFRQREPHRAAGRSHRRDRRAHGRLLDDVQVRRLQRAGEARASHAPRPGRSASSFPVTLGVTGSTLSFVKGLTRACRQSRAEEVVGRRARKRAPTGKPSSRARCGTKPSRSSRSSSRT